jgi:hypothetical protein
VGATSSANVLATGLAWRLTGRTSAGRKLVRAVNNGGEDEQTIAGMFLAKAGDRAVPLIREALAEDAPSPTLVDVLASIGTDIARAELQRVASGSGHLAEAAREALRTLGEIGRHQS